MSTAEKLRALDLRPFAFVENQSGTEAVAIELSLFRQWQRVHPQLVAVLETAELMPKPQAHERHDGVPYLYARRDECDALHSALAALEESLS